MNGDCRISQHRFRTCGGHDHMRWFTRFGVDHRIHEVPEISIDGFVFNFVVADGGTQIGVPVDQSLAAIDV